MRWLFVNAVVWHVSENRPERLPAMCTAFVQARALYEFYYANGKGDDARARHFADSWTESPSNLYLKYMAARTPAEKRVFHLVYGRSKAANAGGPGFEGPGHLKNQVLNFAKDLRRITEKFVICVRPEFRNLVQAALDYALVEAKRETDLRGVPNPLP
jgi:hypothetical protein